ncbi:MAG: SPFH/Band 7/PHB domain protein [Oscillospiraceae bacterium]|nr:SPFH/Band 7/PHB domain protein [Ruminococcus sp.]MBQ7003186.1 SPFH/Band 7/PHB domain protein [Oscillospiraceae bacterium]MBQ7013776.1 SPFH/Band 7/PHB domain protein [Oscillospiraceae bacterium]
MDYVGYFIIGLIIFLVIVLVNCIRIVPQAHVYVVERLGTFRTEWQTGPHILMPFFDRVARKVSIKERVVDFPPQQVITKDNVTMQIDTVVFFQVTDAKRYTYGVENPMMAIENFTATTLRNIIGEMELDATLTSRDVINTKITAILDEETDRWGIKVIRVELKNILPPREIQDSMEKQMKAERERREKILQAEGEKKSMVLSAEAEKESKILRAQADKEAEILRATAEKEAMILRADAVREQKIREAEGEAQAIAAVQTALAESLERLNQSNPNQAVLQLKALEAFAKAADGKATKLIIPSEIQGLAGLAAGLKAVSETTEETK